MDYREQLKKWVEEKIEKVINKDLKETIVEESSPFDVETYVNTLMDTYFSENSVNELKQMFNYNDFYDELIYSELEYTSEERNSLNDPREFDSNENQTLVEQEIVKNLESNSKEIKKKSLKVLERSVEDFVNHASWSIILQSLQKILTKTKDKESHNLVFKIFQKLLKCSKKPQAICKGFTSVAKLMAKQIVLYNAVNENTLPEEIYGLTDGKRLCRSNLEHGHKITKSRHTEEAEILIKLMWLLVDCQQQMPLKWVRFNESRFREVIFSFVHLLSSTTISENKKLSGLELLSVLNPTATWCRYYCHTAVGRSLLCSALKKYKTFFTHVVDIILTHIKTKKFNKLPPLGVGLSANKSSQKIKNDISKMKDPINKISKLGYETEKHTSRLKPVKLNRRNNPVRSAPVQQNGENNSEGRRINKSKNLSSDWIVKGIPLRIVSEAVFCHSVSFVTCLIQFRSGRALFPLQMPARNRLLSIQDFSSCLAEYLESLECQKWDNSEIIFTSNYKTKLLGIADILKNVKIDINSARDKRSSPFLIYENSTTTKHYKKFPH